VNATEYPQGLVLQNQTLQNARGEVQNRQRGLRGRMPLPPSAVMRAMGTPVIPELEKLAEELGGGSGGA